MPRIHIRVSDKVVAQIQQAASQRGFGSPSVFIRQAIANELRSGDSELREVEERIAASLDRLAREVRRVQTAQQAEYALLDSFVRLFLMCVPEPSPDAMTSAKARAGARYGNFLRNVALNMTGDSRAALAQLLGHD